MSAVERKQRLADLVAKYSSFKQAGKLDLTSEETIRTWLNELLQIFGWDVMDTSQILQEKVLSKAEKHRLTEIGSTNSRPDYTLKVASQKLTFLDAKDITVSIDSDTEAAFQIKSYGWSILAPCAFISNFEEFAIYDCTYVPDQSHPANLGRLYFRLNDYVSSFEIIDEHLLKENIYEGRLTELYAATMQEAAYVQKITPDLAFANLLSNFRLQLASDILTNNPAYIGHNAGNLSYVTQVIINRILFIRVCEARRIDEEGLLTSFQKQGFWNSFKDSSYFQFYEHYDGPLFERINAIHELTITDTAFDALLTHLYYPSPYRFDVIPTKLLSDVYELFLAKKLIIEAGTVRDEIKAEYLKTRGAVSTPHFVVQDIVRRTIESDKLYAGDVAALFQQKILDIACGSGVFAIEAFDYLHEVLLQLYLSKPDPLFKDYFIDLGGHLAINLGGKKAIIDNCIFGVDIDPEAVEVAKMSLSLKIIDSADYLESYHELGIYGEQILNGIGNNIRCGNSLVESDILTRYPKLAENEDELIKINVFDWNSADGFEAVFAERGGFDYIIGNPPYVEVKNYNVDLPYMHRYIKEYFSTARNGKIDLSVPFIEKSLSLLNEHGRLGFIIQKRFFKTDYGRSIRELISSANSVASIIDFKSTSIFKGRRTYVAILILSKSATLEFHYKQFPEAVEKLPAAVRSTALPSEAPIEYTLIPTTAITGNPWSFDDEQLIAIKSRLSAAGKLGDYAKVKVGFQALWVKAYHIRPLSITAGIITGRSGLEDSFKIEEAACRPLLCNEDFYPYREAKGDVYVVFPYDIIGGVARQVGFAEYLHRYPLAGNYLQRNRAVIEAAVQTLPKIDPENYTADSWLLYTRANNLKDTYPKVMIPMTALDTIATVTTTSTPYCDNANVFFVDAPAKDLETLYALSAIINSTIFSVLARSIANPQATGYFKFNKQFLEPVPFPVATFQADAAARRQLAALAKRIERSQQRFINSSPAQKRIIGNQINTMWKELDAACYILYDLSEAEIAFFNNRGRNVHRLDLIKS